jgi:CheY-like chemotaxis protein
MELKDATVLIVDDEPMVLDIFREWLQEEGCRVLTGGDGACDQTDFANGQHPAP